MSCETSCAKLSNEELAQYQRGVAGGAEEGFNGAVHGSKHSGRQAHFLSQVVFLKRAKKKKKNVCQAYFLFHIELKWAYLLNYNLKQRYIKLAFG